MQSFKKFVCAYTVRIHMAQWTHMILQDMHITSSQLVTCGVATGQVVAVSNEMQLFCS